MRSFKTHNKYPNPLRTISSAFSLSTHLAEPMQADDDWLLLGYSSSSTCESKCTFDHTMRPEEFLLMITGEERERLAQTHTHSHKLTVVGLIPYSATGIMILLSEHKVKQDNATLCGSTTATVVSHLRCKMGVSSCCVWCGRPMRNDRQCTQAVEMGRGFIVYMHMHFPCGCWCLLFGEQRECSPLWSTRKWYKTKISEYHSETTRPLV